MGNYCLKRCCLWNLEWEFSETVEKRQVMMYRFGSQQIQSSIKSKCKLVMVVRQVKGVINCLRSCKISLSKHSCFTGQNCTYVLHLFLDFAVFLGFGLSFLCSYFSKD